MLAPSGLVTMPLNIEECDDIELLIHSCLVVQTNVIKQVEKVISNETINRDGGAKTYTSKDTS